MSKLGVPPEVAAVLGTYKSSCLCRYRVFWRGGQLWMARTRPGLAEGEPYPVELEAVKRQLHWGKEPFPAGGFMARTAEDIAAEQL